MNTRSTSYYVLVLCTAAWCVTLLLPPLLAASSSVGNHLAALGYKFFSRICHQIDSRSLHLFGRPIAVCVRCFSIYFGFFSGVLFAGLSSRLRLDFYSRVQKYSSIWLFLFVLPMLLDVLIDSLSGYSSNFGTRMATGFFFGTGAGFVLTPIILSAMQEFIAILMQKRPQLSTRRQWKERLHAEA